VMIGRERERMRERGRERGRYSERGRGIGRRRGRESMCVCERERERARERGGVIARKSESELACWIETDVVVGVHVADPDAPQRLQHLPHTQPPNPSSTGYELLPS